MNRLIWPIDGILYDRGSVMTIDDYPLINGTWLCVAWFSYKETHWRRYSWWRKAWNNFTRKRKKTLW